ncbi:MAG: (1-_4)-alpha-D-glucan 1-alpha-D-glucosylmutase [Verrucomicrobiota bacterium]|nr:(1->4)-alpha-D-glucan 1-alpha-D-glucosylmutase [Verrucomicrobiota bacterium]
MASGPRVPISTYRLQFNRRFGFKDATEIIPYLQKLGISDLYSSPFFRSNPDSDHGYDVSNHNELNPAIGSREDLDAMVAALNERAMGQIVDFVPNHMGIIDPQNEWWMDVLENGPSSRFAQFFDIDWDPLKEALHNKVLLPVLGDQYGRVLERGDFHLRFEEGGFYLTYYDWVFPLNPRTYHFLLRIALEKLGQYSDEDMYLDLESILTALEYLPPRTDTDDEKIRERAREKEVIKRRISRLCRECPQVEEAIELAIKQIEGRVGQPHSFDKLDKLLDAQAYRLSYWKVAAEEINYRRFFDVNDLAAIRVENPVVFDTIHKFIFELLENRSVTGLRIDHVDGLRDPKLYLTSLQRRYSELVGGDSVEPGMGLYLIVEKILSEDEKLRSDWPVYGTTGYDFTAEVTQLLVDSTHGDQFSKIYQSFIERYVHFDSLIYEKKKLVMDVSLASDIESLGHMLSDVSERDRLHRDFTLDSLRTVVRELIACFPVYRTYISDEAGVSEADRQVILRAVRAAKRRNAAVDTSIFDFLRDILLLEKLDDSDIETHRLRLEFVMKFQQCTGPMMAKGLEDTAFYIFNRLSALNEVGGNPKQFGMSLERFHERNRARLADMPGTLLASTTHDTKRSEDTRARMTVISEIPEDWQKWIHEWRSLNSALKSNIDGDSAPSANEEYLIYQTLLGTWPFVAEEVNEEYVDRIQKYMLKAIKEAKVNSSWIQPNEDWENAVKQFIAGILKADHGFRSKFDPAAATVAWHGMLNSLAQTILKFTVPGVPDIYQGTELWDFSLVDPDNRRPVDFTLCQRLLDEVRTEAAETLFKTWQDGRIKMSITSQLLHLRQSAPALFESGSYYSFYANGDRAECCVAFSRELGSQMILVIVPRFTTRLGTAGSGFDWKETELLFDKTLPAMEDQLNGRTIKPGLDTLPLKTLDVFPFAVYQNLQI